MSDRDTNSDAPAAEHTHAGNALRASEEQFRQIAENVRHGMWIQDARTSKMLYVNRACAQILGQSVEALMSDAAAWRRAIHPEDVVEPPKPGWQAFEEMYRVQRQDGAVRWVTDLTVPIRDERGELVRVAGIIEDVTDRKRAEEALRESEERFRLMVEGSEQVFFYEHDRERCLTYVSPSVANVLGYRAEEMVGRHCEAFLADDASKALAARLTRAALECGERGSLYTMSFRHQKGYAVIGEVMETPIRRGGELICMQGFVRDITERKQAEEALRASEERYRRITEAITDYIFAVRVEDGEPVETVHGPACVAVTGYAAEEFAADPELWIRMVHEDDRAAVAEQASRVLSGQEPEAVEHRIVRKDGVERWVRNALVPHYDSGGGLLSYDGLIHDITERKRAENLIRVQRDLEMALSAAAGLHEGLRLCVEAALRVSGLDCGGVYLIDETSGAIELACHKGLSPDFIGATSHYDAASAGARLVMAGRPAYARYEDLGVRLDEARRSEGLRAVAVIPVRHEGRAIGCVNVASHTLDEVPLFARAALEAIATRVGSAIARLRAEDALREGEHRYRHLFENLNDAAVLADAESGMVLDVNLQAEALLGRTHDEIVGTHQAGLHPPGKGEEYKTRFREHVAKGHAADYDGELVRNDGAIVPVRISATTMAIDGQHLILGLFRDITEARHLEDQLRQAQKMEAIGRLAGGVAHDFNNLLTAINGYSEIILASLGEHAPWRQEVEEIRKAGRRAADLTRQLLTFSRKQMLLPTVLDLNAVIAGVEKLLHRVIGEDIKLVTRPDPNLGSVKADQGQLESAVMNLAVNARDAMPQGGTITIGTANVELDESHAPDAMGLEPGPHVLLTFSDTGTGMAADTLSRIFEPFFTTKEPGTGTGLGLATAYGTVKQSGGHIAADSQPGQGTTFSVYLPRVDDLAEPSQPPQPSPQALQGRETILVVEDEGMVRTLARTVLERHGYTVLEARNAGGALRLCQRHDGPIHLMLTDVVMPLVGGAELADRVAGLRPDMKVLYMSGYDRGVIAKRGDAARLAAFIQKPFSPDALARKVRQALDATPQAPSTPNP